GRSWCGWRTPRGCRSIPPSRKGCNGVRWRSAFLGTMRTARTRRIGRREAEELLSQGQTGPDRAALRHLLDQLAAPPSARELAGRRAAVAAFAQAVRSPVPDPATPARRRRLGLLSRAALVKVVTGLAVLLFGSAA